ncbi:hypothetical protein DFJ58DRAFT_701464 [Suillus subalutaceus]|uniref:uncharacterized protein n=1 Tax=Suillus subalutaceus TaxID=48586 RepID=UPI001B86C20D|nr:uncharacterized protein DFJ58DRAFT_701464 [Suillus subalutaceus]KAG1860219.1 hypothetical protein DFJ58DRAFT_701464 [Suillus subalutaceus]
MNITTTTCFPWLSLEGALFPRLSKTILTASKMSPTHLIDLISTVRLIPLALISRTATTICRNTLPTPLDALTVHLENTRDEPGIDLDTARNLENTFAFEPPLTIQSNNIDDLLAGPEDISVDEIDAEFDALEKQDVVESFEDVDIDGLEILEGNVYNFDELARVEAGMVPKSIDEEFSVIDHGVRGWLGCCIIILMSTNGFLTNNLPLPSFAMAQP